MKTKILLSALLLLCGMVNAQNLKSPDGKLECDYGVENGRPFYSLKKNGVTIIDKSFLGFVFTPNAAEPYTFKKTVDNSDVDFYSGFEQKGVKNSSFKETWKPVWGEESEILNSYNEATVTFTQKTSGKSFDVCFRLFDDGLGFRYEFPVQKNFAYFVVKHELT